MRRQLLGLVLGGVWKNDRRGRRSMQPLPRVARAPTDHRPWQQRLFHLGPGSEGGGGPCCPWKAVLIRQTATSSRAKMWRDCGDVESVGDGGGLTAGVAVPEVVGRRDGDGGAGVVAGVGAAGGSG